MRCLREGRISQRPWDRGRGSVASAATHAALAVLLCMAAAGCQSLGAHSAYRSADDDAAPPRALLGTPVEQPPVALFRGDRSAPATASRDDRSPIPAAAHPAARPNPNPSSAAEDAGLTVASRAASTPATRADAFPEAPRPLEQAEGVVRLTAPAASEDAGRAAGRSPSGRSSPHAESHIRRVAHDAAPAADAAASHADAVRFHPAEPRFPLASDAGAPASRHDGGVAFAPSAGHSAGRSARPIDADAPAGQPATAGVEDHPDEYVVDGGDRGLPVHYDTFSRYGLETEDTVAEYSDDTGQRHVLPTNRVAIFAPRFGAVQTVSGVGSGTQIEKLAYARDQRRSSAVGARSVVDTKQQHETAVAARMRSRASGLEGSDAGRTMRQALSVVRHVKLLNAFQDVGLLKTGRVDQADQARLAYGLQAALQWSREQFPVISAQTASLHEVTARFRPAEIVGRSLEHLKKGRLRIVKLADKKVAHPGDVITFTIRFDNLGDRPLHHVRIVDNLTPRLEFIDDSAQADRPGTLTIEDNEEGSVVLTFELDEPLAGHSGGVITFQARLR